MTDYDLDDQPVSLDPLLAMLQHRHTLARVSATNDEKAAAKDAIMNEIKTHNMAPFYRLVCDMFGWPPDEAYIATMTHENDKAIADLDKSIKDATENLGDTEVQEALQRKGEYYARIGDLDRCLEVNEECYKKTLAAGARLDLIFQRIRLGIAFGNNDIAARGLQDAQRLFKDADWERRNRLKVYEGLYHVFVRNFEKGSKLLIDALATFASTELIPFRDFVFIAVLSALPTLSRADLRKKVVTSPEVISASIPEVDKLISSIYECRYGEVFPALSDACHAMRKVVYLSAHVDYFFREMRVMIFNQFLDSYSSVTLKSMSAAFQIPEPVLDKMLFALISNERIACKIDRVTGSVMTYRGDATNLKYHRLLKNGDLLLNRIQKLSRLVEM